MSDLTELREAIAQHDDGEAGTHQYSEVVAAARLVASGEVVARADLREVAYCAEHEMQATIGYKVPTSCYRWREMNWMKGVEPCRIVSAGLLLPGDE